MSIYDTLNEQQKKGVFTTEGPVLLLRELARERPECLLTELRI